MSEPQRYAPVETFDAPGLEPDAEGYWIQLPDYQALRSKFDALLDDVRRIESRFTLRREVDVQLRRAIENAEQEEA